MTSEKVFIKDLSQLIYGQSPIILIGYTLIRGLPNVHSPSRMSEPLNEENSLVYWIGD